MSRPSDRSISPAVSPDSIRLEIFETLEAAEPAWRALQDGDCLGTAYQRLAWIAAWQSQLGVLQGISPFVVVGSDEAGEILFLWPFGRERIGPLVVARFLGGRHANLNLCLWRRDFAERMTGPDLAALTARLRGMKPGIDLLVLQNQPIVWEGVTNPFAHLPYQPSPSAAFRGALQADFEEVLKTRIGNETRRKLRQKERSLGRRGALAFWRAEDESRQRQVLDAFFVQKADRMSELGLDNVFAEPGVRAFVEAASIGEAPMIELYAASLDDTILATFGGIASQTRFSGMFNSLIKGSLAHDSPGELLLSHVVRMACERGLSIFDLGVGDAGYKRGFCNEEEALIDSVLGVTLLGRAAAPLWRTRLAAKRTIKGSTAWQKLTAFRRKKSRAAAKSVKPPKAD